MVNFKLLYNLINKSYVVHGIDIIKLKENYYVAKPSQRFTTNYAIEQWINIINFMKVDSVFILLNLEYFKCIKLFLVHRALFFKNVCKLLYLFSF